MSYESVSDELTSESAFQYDLTKLEEFADLVKNEELALAMIRLKAAMMDPEEVISHIATEAIAAGELRKLTSDQLDLLSRCIASADSDKTLIESLSELGESIDLTEKMTSISEGFADVFSNEISAQKKIAILLDLRENRIPELLTYISSEDQREQICMEAFCYLMKESLLNGDFDDDQMLTALSEIIIIVDYIAEKRMDYSLSSIEASMMKLINHLMRRSSVDYDPVQLSRGSLLVPVELVDDRRKEGLRESAQGVVDIASERLQMIEGSFSIRNYERLVLTAWVKEFELKYIYSDADAIDEAFPTAIRTIYSALSEADSLSFFDLIRAENAFSDVTDGDELALIKAVMNDLKRVRLDNALRILGAETSSYLDVDVIKERCEGNDVLSECLVLVSRDLENGDELRLVDGNGIIPLFEDRDVPDADISLIRDTLKDIAEARANFVIKDKLTQVVEHDEYHKGFCGALTERIESVLREDSVDKLEFLKAVNEFLDDFEGDHTSNVDLMAKYRGVPGFDDLQNLLQDNYLGKDLVEKFAQLDYGALDLNVTLPGLGDHLINVTDVTHLISGFVGELKEILCDDQATFEEKCSVCTVLDSAYEALLDPDSDKITTFNTYMNNLVTAFKGRRSFSFWQPFVKLLQAIGIMRPDKVASHAIKAVDRAADGVDVIFDWMRKSATDDENTAEGSSAEMTEGVADDFSAR
ncbi:MAG: hypothetical protein JXR42_01525 [Gammaproteobacteria bacterium]|nr:hypothetical protein [Gammaproteobacteria bacterium]